MKDCIEKGTFKKVSVSIAVDNTEAAKFTREYSEEIGMVLLPLVARDLSEDMCQRLKDVYEKKGLDIEKDNKTKNPQVFIEEKDQDKH